MTPLASVQVISRSTHFQDASLEAIHGTRTNNKTHNKRDIKNTKITRKNTN